MTRINTALLCSVLGLGLTPAFAQGWGPGGYPGPVGGPVGFYSCGRGLDLSDAQRAKLDAIQKRHQAKLDAKFRDATAARLALAEARTDANADEGRIQAGFAKMAAAQAAVALEHRAMDQEFAAILTPEQKQAWAGWQGWRGTGGGPGWGRGGCGAGRWGGY